MTQNARIKRTYVGITGELTIAPYVMSIKQISDWVNSLNSAYSTINPNRRRLYDLYESIILDTQYISVSGKRRMAVTNKKIEFIQNGKISEEMRGQFQTPWFWELIGHAMDALFWSHSLIEFKLEAGVISGVDLIPRQNTNPDLNTIFWDPNIPSDGIAINDPAVDPYLINVQCKQNHRFGLLASLVPYILYKRGSLADWSQFCEIFGLPFKEVTYDPYDSNSKKQAEQAMKSMGGAGYVILPNGTSVKIHDTNKTGSMDVFNGLARYCDEQIAKAVLGQTMTTDNGSSKSQAQVHKDVEESVNLNDIIWIEYLLNWQVKKKLEKFGHPLSQGRFQFDMTKEIPLEKRIEMDTKLADQIEIDPKYWYETYNIPEPKSGPAKATLKPTPPPGEPSGKPGGGRTGKVNLIDEVEQIYNQTHQCGEILLADSIDENRIVKSFEKWVKQVYNGNAPAINQDILTLTASTLAEGIVKGFAKPIYDEPDVKQIYALLNNAWQFAGAKVHTQGVELNKLLTDSDGKIKTFEEFKRDAGKVGTIFNKNWLRTEYQQAIAGAQSASKWVDIQRDKVVFPFLQYDTAGDNKVRPKHYALEGITKPVDDPFWMEYYPPWEWACRCTVRKLAGGVVTSAGTTSDKIEEAGKSRFTNIGVTGKAFPDNLPFFNTAESAKAIVQASLGIAGMEDEIQRSIYEAYISAGYEVLKPYARGAYIVSHPTHGKLEDHERMFFQAQFQVGRKIVLLENLGKKGDRYADSLIDGTRYELKSYIKTSNYDNRIDKDLSNKSNQSGNLILHFTDDSIELQAIFKRIKGSTKAFDRVKSVSVAIKKGQMILFTRDEILSENFLTDSNLKKAKEQLF